MKKKLLYFLWTLMKLDVLEKYLAFASLTFLSAACGLTISSPYEEKGINQRTLTDMTKKVFSLHKKQHTCIGVKATLEAVPETCLLTVVAPPHCCCFCMFFCSVLEILTLVFSSVCGILILPVPDLPMVPLL